MGGILMTDSEKFDLLLSEVRSIRSETQDMKKDMMELSRKMNRIETRQAGPAREIYRIDRKITDIYNLALDIWAASENRSWPDGNRQLPD